MGVDVKVFGGAGAAVVTSFVDTFNRPSGQCGLNWGAFYGTAAGAGIIGVMGIGLCSDAQQGMIVQGLGAGGKADGIAWCTPLNNAAVIGQTQFSQFDLVAEIGTSSFCGPAAAVDPGGAVYNCYGIAYRNHTWRLLRLDGGLETQLIAPAALVIPCTLRIGVRFNGSASNDVFVSRNGVSIGNVNDATGTIKQSGIPGFYPGAPSVGADQSQWRNFSGGIGL